MSAPYPAFYLELPVNEIALSKLFSRAHLFHRFPPDWEVVITDVENSTSAVAGGRQHDINMIATESIVAVMNIVYDHNLDVPFFFGGDGATFIIPGSLLQEVIHSLQTHQENVKKNFNESVRVGHIPVSEIYAQGIDLLVSKTKASKLLSIPVILGDGIAYAEKKIKGDDYMLANFAQLSGQVDLKGMQCRWDRIEPPEDKEEVISLLVLAYSENLQAESFSKVIDCIDSIYGNVIARRAVTIGKLRLVPSLSRLKKEVQSQMQKMVFLRTITEWVKTIIGKFYFTTTKGKTYLNSLVELTDDLVLDGKINTVISGTIAQRKKLEKELDKLEAKQKIIYGLYASSASVMSCYVRDMDLKHIHFVDGADGGYTNAAAVLKRKLLKL